MYKLVFHLNSTDFFSMDTMQCIHVKYEVCDEDDDNNATKRIIMRMMRKRMTMRRKRRSWKKTIQLFSHQSHSSAWRRDLTRYVPRHHSFLLLRLGGGWWPCSGWWSWSRWWWWWWSWNRVPGVDDDDHDHSTFSPAPGRECHHVCRDRLRGVYRNPPDG